MSTVDITCDASDGGTSAPDAGGTDAGTPADAGGTDAGTPADAGTDAGAPVDAGGGTDAGTTSDAGAPPMLAVYRVGDGTTALVNTGSPVFIDEYSTTGTPGTSFALPTVASASNHRLIASGTASSEGLISRSADGHRVVFTGYDVSPGGSTSLAGSASATIPRVIGTLDATGTIDTSTALTDAESGNNPRSATTVDGSTFWLTGATGGVYYANHGASTSNGLISTTVANLRQVNIFSAQGSSQLYVSTSSGSAVRIGTVGTGLPTNSGQTITNLTGIPTSGSPYGFFLADVDATTPGLDTLYVADDGASGTTGGLTKYALVGGTWTAKGTIGSASDAYRGVTGIVNGTTVTLFAVRGGGTTATGGGQLVSIVDSAGFGGTLSATPTVLATAGTNIAYRGVTLAPQP
jgi:hypothetical protein